MLRLLSFLQTPRDWTGAELAERLEVSQRTIRNDIERLRSLGYQVQATRGPIGGYRLASGTTVPPLLLDDDEAVALAVALRTGAGGGTDGSRRHRCAPSQSSSRSFPRACAAVYRRCRRTPCSCAGGGTPRSMPTS